MSHRAEQTEGRPDAVPAAAESTPRLCPHLAPALGELLRQGANIVAALQLAWSRVDLEATLDSVQGANVWLTISIREGKNREVRKILSIFALDVNRLIRVSYGPFQLLDLQPGMVEPVRRRSLADQLGAKLTAEFHLVDTAADRKARWSGDKERGDKTGGDKPRGDRKRGKPPGGEPS